MSGKEFTNTILSLSEFTNTILSLSEFTNTTFFLSEWAINYDPSLEQNDWFKGLGP